MEPRNAAPLPNSILAVPMNDIARWHFVRFNVRSIRCLAFEEVRYRRAFVIVLDAALDVVAVVVGRHRVLRNVDSIGVDEFNCERHLSLDAFVVFGNGSQVHEALAGLGGLTHRERLHFVPVQFAVDVGDLAPTLPRIITRSVYVFVQLAVGINSSRPGANATANSRANDRIDDAPHEGIVANVSTRPGSHSIGAGLALCFVVRSAIPWARMSAIAILLGAFVTLDRCTRLQSLQSRRRRERCNN